MLLLLLVAATVLSSLVVVLQLFVDLGKEVNHFVLNKDLVQVLAGQLVVHFLYVDLLGTQQLIFFYVVISDLVVGLLNEVLLIVVLQVDVVRIYDQRPHEVPAPQLGTLQQFVLQVDWNVVIADNVLFNEVHALTKLDRVEDPPYLLGVQQQLKQVVVGELAGHEHEELQVPDSPVEFLVSVVLVEVLEHLVVGVVDGPKQNQASHLQVPFVCLRFPRHFALGWIRILFFQAVVSL